MGPVLQELAPGRQSPAGWYLTGKMTDDGNDQAVMRQRVTGTTSPCPTTFNISESLVTFAARLLAACRSNEEPCWSQGIAVALPRSPMLSLLGAGLPENLMLPKEGNNEAGFWSRWTPIR